MRHRELYLAAISLVFLLSVSLGAQTGTRLLYQPDISNNRIVFLHAGDVWTAALDGRNVRRLTQTPESESWPKLSPDGKWLAFTRSNSIYLMPTEGGAERRLTWYPDAHHVVGWTVDGRKLLIHSDRWRGSLTETPHLFLLPMEGGEMLPLPIPRATHGSFSSDSRSIVYGPNPEIVYFANFKHYRGGSIGYLATYNLETGAYSELPRSKTNDIFPMWHGNSIYFLSDRTGTMNLYRYDLGSKQTETLTHADEWDVRNPNQGSKGIIYENSGWLYLYDFANKSSHQIPVKLPDEALPKPEDQQKWQQLLSRAWEVYSQHAFCPRDSWAGMKAKYEPLMRWATDVNDARYVTSEMLSEAGQSHVGFGLQGTAERRDDVGLLGADFALEEGVWRIKKIYAGDTADEKQRGPLAAPGVEIHEGDYLLAVNGTPLDARQEVYAAFVKTAQRKTILTVNQRPSLNGARTVEVTPVGREVHLRHAEWIKENRARVQQASHGRVAYLAISGVDPGDLEVFRKQWQAMRNEADAVILDARSCTGGVSADDFAALLQARPERRMYDRKRMVPPYGVFFDAPKVLLVNELSVSGCDELPLLAKQTHAATIVGTRTFGGMIGSGATYKLPAGGTLSLPEYGFYSEQLGWSPENYGVEPDVEIELKPLPLSGGVDPQLEKAIEVVLQAAANYKKMPPPPAYIPAE